jgi:hypothetical protein
LFPFWKTPLISFDQTLSFDLLSTALHRLEMVAEAVEPKVKSSAKPRSSPNWKLRPKIDLLTRSQARNLYVVRQLSAQEVATQTGLTPRQVYDLADRENWTKTRAEIKRKSAEALQAREAEDIEELVEAVAIKSKLLSLGSLDASIDELAVKGKDRAKNLQAYSQAAKNFVGLYRQAKSLDVAAQSGNVTNVLFISCARAGMNEPAALPAKAEPINVTPAKPADVTQVASEA